jgi:hypothetical protein
MTTTTTPRAAVISGPAVSEALVRAFAAQFPTPNVTRMVTLAEAGVITWLAAERLAVTALDAGLAEVRSPAS